jgi:2-polyprenyl-3-methyl-5-hydroxy-6-metoxy-1,4-benzoquinol methylase
MKKTKLTNTPELWDQVWADPLNNEENNFNLKKEESSIRWQRIEKIIFREFGSFKNLRIIEIGAGAGTNTALALQRGAKVTILDYSTKALKRAREFFASNNLSAEFLKQDALSLPKNLYSKYDVSMSFGLSEHFKGPERIKINKAHFDLIRNGGIAFISVPNKYNLPYRLFKFVAKLAGEWKVGEEFPYSRQEFKKICKKIGINNFSFFGDSLFWSLNLINPVNIIKKKLNLKKNLNLSNIKKEKGTFLDEYLSYALILYGKK